ncbi:uncharacterized protein LOC103510659 [Diaphorina citri]|uniref:Uncharacterized protein LOC103510659 n=1 Tax=Diaphorina citri TaxID=121845 RepID=A0A3Q0IVM6_DIACI|nr:uncharacterized protein LOC103510659 [Diaphorina citri]
MGSSGGRGPNAALYLRLKLYPKNHYDIAKCIVCKYDYAFLSGGGGIVSSCGHIARIRRTGVVHNSAYLASIESLESSSTLDETPGRGNGQLRRQRSKCGTLSSTGSGSKSGPLGLMQSFVRNNEGFSIYTDYCTNYPRTMSVLTELMRQENGAKLFRERQIALAHTLPLGSYLSFSREIYKSGLSKTMLRHVLNKISSLRSSETLNETSETDKTRLSRPKTPSPSPCYMQGSSRLGARIAHCSDSSDYADPRTLFPAITPSRKAASVLGIRACHGSSLSITPPSPAPVRSDSLDGKHTERLATQSNKPNKDTDKTRFNPLKQISEYASHHYISLFYPPQGEDLTTFGELCAEGAFRMSGAKALRHAFLFDKMLLITKKKEEGILGYKAHIMCSNLMLIESSKVSLNSIPNLEIKYSVQARNLDQKREWCLQLKKVILENYNAVIPSHARQLVMQLGQNKAGDEELVEKSSAPKRQHSAPEYLERRKQEKLVNGTRNRGSHRHSSGNRAPQEKSELCLLRNKFQPRVMRKSDVGTTVKSQQEIQRSLLLQQDKKNVPEEVKTQNEICDTEVKTAKDLASEASTEPTPPLNLPSNPTTPSLPSESNPSLEEEHKTLEKIISQLLMQNGDFLKFVNKTAARKHPRRRKLDTSEDEEEGDYDNLNGTWPTPDSPRMRWQRAAQSPKLVQRSGALVRRAHSFSSHETDNSSADQSADSSLSRFSLDNSGEATSLWVKHQAVTEGNKKSDSLPRSFQIGGNQTPDWNMAPRPITIASDKAQELNLVDMQNYINRAEEMCNVRRNCFPTNLDYSNTISYFRILSSRLSDSLDCSPEEQGYEDIKHALATMTSIAQHINLMKRKHEHAVRVDTSTVKMLSATRSCTNTCDLNVVICKSNSSHSSFDNAATGRYWKKLCSCPHEIEYTPYFKHRPVEEPVVGGKEKKRKKLDEIVLGLSAAKGHQDSGPSPSPASSALGAITGSSLFASLSAAASSMAEKQKMPPVTPSISLTAARRKKKMFLVRTKRRNKKPRLNLMKRVKTNPMKKTPDVKMEVDEAAANAGDSEKKEENVPGENEEKKQETPTESNEKSENKSDETQEKQNSNSEDDKKQTALMSGVNDPSEFLSMARRKKNAGSHNPRGPITPDPMALLDWKKLSGDEPVSVVHKTTGQKKSEDSIEEKSENKEETDKPKSEETVPVTNEEVAPSTNPTESKDETSEENKDKTNDKKEDEVMEVDKPEEKTSPDSEKIVEQFEELDEKTGETIVKKITADGKEIIETLKKEEKVEESKEVTVEVKEKEMSDTCDKPNVNNDESSGKKQQENQNSSSGAGDSVEVKKDSKSVVNSVIQLEDFSFKICLFLSLLLEANPSGRGSPNTPTPPGGSVDTTVANLLAQSYNNPIKWPKEHALQVRLQHIVTCVEKGEWPASRNFSAYTSTGTGVSAGELEFTPSGGEHTPKRETSTPRSETSEVITITTADLPPSIPHPRGSIDKTLISALTAHTASSHSPSSNASSLKRKRHIAIDVETERAKLHALLNSNLAAASPHLSMKSSPSPWPTPTQNENEDTVSEDSRSDSLDGKHTERLATQSNKPSKDTDKTKYNPLKQISETKLNELRLKLSQTRIENPDMKPEDKAHWEESKEEDACSVGSADSFYERSFEAMESLNETGIFRNQLGYSGISETKLNELRLKLSQTRIENSDMKPEDKTDWEESKEEDACSVGSADSFYERSFEAMESLNETGIFRDSAVFSDQEDAFSDDLDVCIPPPKGFGEQKDNEVEVKDNGDTKENKYVEEIKVSEEEEASVSWSQIRELKLPSMENHKFKGECIDNSNAENKKINSKLDICKPRKDNKLCIVKPLMSLSNPLENMTTPRSRKLIQISKVSLNSIPNLEIKYSEKYIKGDVETKTSKSEEKIECNQCVPKSRRHSFFGGGAVKEKSEDSIEEKSENKEETDKPKSEETVPGTNEEVAPSTNPTESKDETSEENKDKTGRCHEENKDKTSDKKEDEVMEVDKPEEKSSPDSEKIVEQFEELDEKTGETIVKKITADGKEIIETLKKEEKVEESKEDTVEVKEKEISDTCDKPNVNNDESSGKKQQENQNISSGAGESVEVKKDSKSVVNSVIVSSASATTDVDKFKAMFPELEVMQRLPEIDAILLEANPSGRGSPNTPTPPGGSVDTTVANLLAQSYNNPIKWPKISGSKAPTLKRLGQWLQENPMYDVDPKWADLVKERGGLPPPAHDVQSKRMPSSSSMKNKGRNSNTVIASPPSQSIPVSQSTSQSLPTSLASSLPFPSLAGAAGLGALPPSLLSGLSGIGNYDPKNNPLLLPFGGMPNLGALSGLGNMNLSNSLFANLAGLGLPSLGGMDPSALADAAAASQANSQGGQSSSKSKNRKSSSTSDAGNKNPPTSTASSMASQLPFFFPNPSLLYTPLGLGGLNPFPLPPGAMPSAYESLLLNGGLPTTSGSSSSSSRHKSSTSTSRTSTVTTPASSRTPHPHPSQFSDSHLLESLTRASRGLPDLTRGARGRGGDVESLKNLMSAIPPFAGMGDLGSSSTSTSGGASSKKSRDQEMKDALDSFKSSAELFARIPQYSDEKGKPISAADLVERHLKRPAMEIPPMDKPSKRIKDMTHSSSLPKPTTAPGGTGAYSPMDLSASLPKAHGASIVSSVAAASSGESVGLDLSAKDHSSSHNEVQDFSMPSRKHKNKKKKKKMARHQNA